MDARYEGLIRIPEIGTAGFAKLQSAAVLVVGAGGLGCTALSCLAGLGVGAIRVADRDRVERKNLDRQFLYAERDVGRFKAEAAAERLREMNAGVSLDARACEFNEETAADLLKGVTLAMAAVDNRETRLVMNRLCAAAGVPLINGGVRGLLGSVQQVRPDGGACLACVGMDGSEGEPIPSPASVVAWTASVMAQCALLTILGEDETIRSTLFYLDGRTLAAERVPLQRAENCPVCGGK